MDDPTGIVLPFAALVVGATAIYHAGVLRGRFDKHEAMIEKRVDGLEAINLNKITREELDARFDGMERQIEEVAGVVRRAMDTLTRREKT